MWNHSKQVKRNEETNWSVEPLERRVMLAADAAVAFDTPAPMTDVPAEVVVDVSSDQVSARGGELVFIDPTVEGAEDLLEGLSPDAELVLLDPTQSAIKQITNSLANRTNVSSIHVVTHGSAGKLHFASGDVDAESLSDESSQLKLWKRSLADSADILLYACNTAGGEVGNDFVQRLAALTGADVAASTDVTGSKPGADWDLEFATGSIEANLVFDANARGHYQHTLGSTIGVRARGDEGGEQFRLLVDGEDVGVFTVTTSFQSFTHYTPNESATADDIRIEFINDQFRPDEGIDANLVVDHISLDGAVYETEAPTTYTTGTWDGSSIASGFLQSETLHSNGYFQFASGATGGGNEGSTVVVTARGDEGGENLLLQVDGNTVSQWQVGTHFADYTYQSSETVASEQVRIVFDNDLYDPSNGIDRNLQVDRISIDGHVTETESNNVFSTGTWTSDGLTPGYKNSEYLHSNGYFQLGEKGGGNGGGGDALANVEARTEFGVDNDIEDLLDPTRASRLVRVTEASYPGDGSGAQWDAPEPSQNPQLPPNTPNNTGTAVQPLKVTDNIYAPGSDENRPNSGGLNEFSQFFAQFVTHDMVHSVRAAGPPIFLDGQFIPVARTPAIPGPDGVLQQVSSDTPTLDLGLVYGKDAVATETLREVVHENGHWVAGAKLIAGGAGDVLPSYAEVAAHRGQDVQEIQQILGKTFLNLPPEASISQAATGDERANQTTSLTVHHTIWFRNHNWHVDQLRAGNSDWSEEQLYQAARALNEAEFQKITYDEYLPALIGEHALAEYTGYKSDVDPSIINEWTTVAFRFGHDQASDGQILISDTGEISFIPLPVSSLIANGGQNIKTDEALGDWTRGQLAQSSQEIDGRIVPSLRNALFGVPGDQDGNDGSSEEFLQLNLPLLDIHRGRDHGVSDYNQLRAGLGLQTYDSLDHFAEANGLSHERLGQLKSVYSDISELDSIVGGLLEAKVPGSQLGETFTVLNVMQFENTRNGDPFYYENRFADSPETLAQIEQATMSGILQRVGAVDAAQPNAFLTAPQGSVVSVTARGDTGHEVLSLEVDGQRVRSWQVDTEFNTFTWRALTGVAPEQVRIVYENDVWNLEYGIDRNLQVDKVDFDGTTIEIESNFVYSTGSWLPSDGIQPGYRFSEYLNSAGYFQFGFGLG